MICDQTSKTLSYASLVLLSVFLLSEGAIASDKNCRCSNGRSNGSRPAAAAVPPPAPPAEPSPPSGPAPEAKSGGAKQRRDDLNTIAADIRDIERAARTPEESQAKIAESQKEAADALTALNAALNAATPPDAANLQKLVATLVKARTKHSGLVEKINDETRTDLEAAIKDHPNDFSLWKSVIDRSVILKSQSLP